MSCVDLLLKEAFCRLAVMGKISMVDNLRRKGIIEENIYDICSMCKKEKEPIKLFSYILTFLPSFAIASFRNVVQIRA